MLSSKRCPRLDRLDDPVHQWKSTELREPCASRGSWAVNRQPTSLNELPIDDHEGKLIDECRRRHQSSPANAVLSPPAAPLARCNTLP